VAWNPSNLFKLINIKRSKSAENTTPLYPALYVVMWKITFRPFCTVQNRGMSRQLKLMAPAGTSLLARILFHCNMPCVWGGGGRSIRTRPCLLILNIIWHMKKIGSHCSRNYRCLKRIFTNEYGPKGLSFLSRSVLKHEASLRIMSIPFFRITGFLDFFHLPVF
jgi:hypothetical protein